MTGHQKAVLWLGLLMIAGNLVAKWSSIRDVIFNGAGSSSGGKSASSGNITVNPPGQGVTVPFGGFPITIPF